MKTIYIAGKMRGRDRYGYDEFAKAEEKLKQLGWSTINPHREDLDNKFNVLTYDPAKHGLTWDDYPPAEMFSIVACRNRCSEAVTRSDAIFVLNGGVGEGVIRECVRAVQLEKPIYLEQDGYWPTPDDGTFDGHMPKTAKQENYINAKGDILNAAIQHVCGERDKSYGPAYVHHGKLAAAANAIFGTKFTAADIGKLWILDKIIRSLESPHKRDHYEDIAGYSACAWECAEFAKKGQ